MNMSVHSHQVGKDSSGGSVGSPPIAGNDPGEPVSVRRRLIRALMGLEDLFGRYSKALVAQQLLRDIGLSPELLNLFESEVAQAYLSYESEREGFVERFVNATIEIEHPRSPLEARERLDQLLLASRREVLRDAAAAFMPHHTDLRGLELSGSARREGFLAHFGFKPDSEEPTPSAADS